MVGASHQRESGLGQDGSIDTRNFWWDASGDLIGMTRDSDGDGLPEQRTLIRDRDGRLARYNPFFPGKTPRLYDLVKRNIRVKLSKSLRT